MNTSIFIAKLIGPLFFVIGLALLVSSAAYREAADEVIKSRALLYVFGCIGFAVGLAIVLTHNVWVWGWPVIITILGWLLMVRGALRILIPQQVADLGAKVLQRNPNLLPIGGFVMLVIGAILGYFGYFA
ncbi:MAG: hypothetical protein ACTSRM_02500 [Alphaproteobacteria bacterium]